MATPPILIAGAGIAGMSLALALARRGLSARLLERRPELSEAGAGIQLGPNAMHVLERIGVAARLEPMAGRPRAIEIHDGAGGRRLGVLPLGDPIRARFGAPYRVAHRADLQAALLGAVEESAAIDMVAGFEVADWRETADRVEVVSENGAGQEGSILVGADGIWSAVRRRLHPDHALTYAGKMAARTMIPASLSSAPFTNPATGVWLGRDAHVVHYPVRADREIAVVAILDEPVPSEGWGGEIEAATVLRRLSGFAPALLAFLDLGVEWRAWSLYDPPPLPAWSRGRVGLIGDAAHPILPFLAQGGAMAIEDADTLAALIAARLTAPAAALTGLEAVRRARVQRVQRVSRENGRIFHLHGVAGIARNLALGIVPGWLLMRRYDWLYGWKEDGPAA
jgi:salicylate hydroxylase